LQGLREKLRAKSLPQQDYEDLLEKGYEDLVMMLKEREKQVAQYSSQHALIIIPDSVQEFDEKFTFVSTQLGHQSFRKKYFEPKDSCDVQNSTIISLMLVRQHLVTNLVQSLNCDLILHRAY
jgi:hypothetical protein